MFSSAAWLSSRRTKLRPRSCSGQDSSNMGAASSSDWVLRCRLPVLRSSCLKFSVISADKLQPSSAVSSTAPNAPAPVANSQEPSAQATACLRLHS
eukprot:5160622-Pyramimonas_sp.AAC.1